MSDKSERSCESCEFSGINMTCFHPQVENCIIYFNLWQPKQDKSEVNPLEVFFDCPVCHKPVSWAYLSMFSKCTCGNTTFNTDEDLIKPKQDKSDKTVSSIQNCENCVLGESPCDERRNYGIFGNTKSCSKWQPIQDRVHPVEEMDIGGHVLREGKGCYLHFYQNKKLLNIKTYFHDIVLAEEIARRINEQR